MVNRTRTFVLVASGIVVLGVAGAGMASLGGLNGLLQDRAADELSFVPADAELIGYADIRHLVDSALQQRLQLIPAGEPGRGPGELLTRTGINLHTDVDTLVVALLAGGGTPATGRSPLLLARGRFDRPRIENLLLSDNGDAATYNGTWVVTSGTGSLAVAFVEWDVVAVGDPASVRAVIDTRAAGAGSVRDNAATMAVVQRVNHASTWAVTRFDALRQQPTLPATLASQLPAITWFAASGDVDGGVAATIHAEARDLEAARDLGEMVRGFVALVRMQVGPQPAFAGVLESMQLSTDGTTVSLAFSIPPDVIDQLTALGQSHGSAPAAPDDAQPLDAPVLSGPSI